MAKRIELTQNQLNFIKENYPKLDYTLDEMSSKLGVSVETIRRRAKEMGLERPKYSIYGKDLEWLKTNYNKPYKELTEYLGVDEETIRATLNRIGITRTTKYRPFKIDPNDNDFWNDIDNPRLTAPAIVRKYEGIYDISESTVWLYRRKRQIKPQINWIESESEAEREVRLILDDLDVAYIQEKKFGKYHIDFYLGFRACIEVQGAYWHNRKTRKVQDSNKCRFMTSIGYKILYIDEKDTNKEEKILKFLQELGFPIS